MIAGADVAIMGYDRVSPFCGVRSDHSCQLSYYTGTRQCRESREREREKKREEKEIVLTFIKHYRPYLFPLSHQLTKILTIEVIERERYKLPSWLIHVFLNGPSDHADPLYPLGPAAAYVRRHCISQIAAAAADTQHSFLVKNSDLCVSQQNSQAYYLKRLNAANVADG